MKPLSLALIFLVAIRAVDSDSPERREVTDPQTITSSVAKNATPVPVDDLFFTRSTGGGAWSPDGKQIVFFTNLTGRNNLWKVNVEGGWPIQLSQSDDRQQFASWSPDGKWIAFQSDKGGGEIYDLYTISGDGGPVVDLTNTPEISETSPVWSPDGRLLALQYKPKASSTIDIAILDWSSRSVRNLTQEKTQDHEWSGAVWSPDGKFVYATRLNSGFTDSDVFQLNVASGSQENLTRHEGEHRATVNSISPDGNVLLMTSDKPGGYPNERGTHITPHKKHPNISSRVTKQTTLRSIKGRFSA